MSKAILGFGLSVTRLAALAGSKLDDIVKCIVIILMVFFVPRSSLSSLSLFWRLSSFSLSPAIDSSEWSRNQQKERKTAACECLSERRRQPNLRVERSSGPSSPIPVLLGPMFIGCRQCPRRTMKSSKILACPVELRGQFFTRY